MNSSIPHFLTIPTRAWQALIPLGRMTGLCILLPIFAYFFLVLPSVEDLHSLQLSHQQERKQFRELRQKRKLQKELLYARQQLVGVWNLLPARKEFAALALTISQQARSENVVIPGMTYSQRIVTKGLPPKGSLSFSASGTYPSIYRFIRHLEESELYLIIEKINVTRTDSSRQAKNGRVRLNMKVSTFLKKDGLQEKNL